MIKRWRWSAMAVVLLAVPANGQGQTLVIWDTKGFSLDLLRPKFREPAIILKRGEPDVEFRARSERMFREWVEDWPREQLVRQLTDSSLKASRASLMDAESSLTTARADYWKTWTALLDDLRRYVPDDAVYLLNDLTRPGVALPWRMLPRPFLAR